MSTEVTGRWVYFNGLECPVPAGTLVNFHTRQTVKLPAGPHRDELEGEAHEASTLPWDEPRLAVFAIVKYRVVAP